MHCAPGTHPCLQPPWRACSQSLLASRFPTRKLCHSSLYLESAKVNLEYERWPFWGWWWSLCVEIHKWEKEKTFNFKHGACLFLRSKSYASVFLLPLVLYVTAKLTSALQCSGGLLSPVCLWLWLLVTLCCVIRCTHLSLQLVRSEFSHPKLFHLGPYTRASAICLFLISEPNCCNSFSTLHSP